MQSIKAAILLLGYALLFSSFYVQSYRFTPSIRSNSLISYPHLSATKIIKNNQLIWNPFCSYSSYRHSVAIKATSSSTINAKSSDKLDKLGKIFVGFILLTYTDRILQSQFKKYAITFPSSLGGMIGVFTLLSGISVINQSMANSILQQCLPVLSFLRAWLALFFIPPLVVLPLKLSMLSGNSVQLFSVIILGLLSSLTLSGGISQWWLNTTEMFTMKSEFQMYLIKKGYKIKNSNVSGTDNSVQSVPLALPSPKVVVVVSFITLFLTGMLKQKGILTEKQVYILRKVFGMQSTIASFLVANKWVSMNVKKIVHPVLTCAILSITSQFIFGKICFIPFDTMLSSYYGFGNGAGDFISSVLGAAIISFGIQLYQYRQLLINNSFRVLITTMVSAIFGLVSTVGLNKLVGIKSGVVASSALTRCITSPLALAGAKLTNADPTLSALIVVITGLLGGAFGSTILKSVLRIDDDISIGLSLGASAHGLGAASVANEPIQFSAAVVSMTLTGLFTVILMSIPQLRVLLLQ